MKKLIIGIILLSLGFNLSAQTGELKITISNIESNEGNIKAALYDQKSGDGFLKEINLAVQKKYVLITNKQATVTFSNIPYGVYAISLFHDKNNNNEIDRSSLGFPIEPYGVSGNKFVLGPPKFNDCKFKIDSSFKTINIEMKSFL